MEYITLNNQVKMPILGLGTFILEPDDAQTAVECALANGHELIDTANAYVNEKAVGRGMKASGKAREEIFLETKLWPCFYESDTAVDETLERLGADYIDLMILHQPAGDFISGYRKLEAAYKAGKLCAIGVSNFNEAEISQVIEQCDVVPAIVQMECHPYFPRTDMKPFLAERGIAVQSWYPLGGRGNTVILDEPVIAELAAKYGKAPAQVIMRWQAQEGNVVIPGSKTPAHIAENIDVFDFELTDAEMAQVSALDKGKPFYVRTDEALAGFAAWHSDVEGQK
ncbi:aldo/keto reductase [Senegalimassilia faecalis]|uniref:Aldo/keto reductase n=1 Tax=Senegalimassilia faecalis TaxID=2509433 RepID=A0A4Q2K4K2_9ACTN|nr:aldo/keto reductase [Senegalimassilia faecalis]RXZ54574.1 aldo/keto reductase [Senegalimassilia faecalis]